MSGERRRVAITGMGSINALGAGIEAFADGLRAGRCGIGELTLFPIAGFRTSRAAEVRQLPMPEWLPQARARRTSRSSLLALTAAREAWERAGLPHGEASETGVILGGTTGGMRTGEQLYRKLVQPEKARRAAGWLATPVSVPVDDVATAFACYGPRLTVSTACSSSANALGIAADWIRSGRTETVLCGGTDSLCQMTYSGFSALQALDADRCRPFDKRRAGLTLGEGAALFVFEAWAHAQRRGARILGEFVSYGVSADAHHLTQPRADGAGAILAMQRALAAADITGADIDYINAHGTATPLNDVMETRTIKAVLGGHAYRVPISSTKSMIGHCLGAAGALEVLASLLAIRDGFIPPTATLEEPDPECDLDYVPSASRPAELRTVLSNSYGFGGNNTSVIIRRYED